MIGGDRWAAYHIYKLQNFYSIVKFVLLPLVRELVRAGILRRHFFVHYFDAGGPHVRFRFSIHKGYDACRCEHVDGLVSRKFTKICEAFGGELLLRRCHFETEVDRYGGKAAYAKSLDFFAISSDMALQYVDAMIDEPRGRQLVAAMDRVLWQAIGFASSAEDLARLLNYFADWRDGAERIVEKANLSFQKNGGRLTKRFLLTVERIANCGELSDAAADEMMIDYVNASRRFAQTLRELGVSDHIDILLSHMHMTANRLGLNNGEEVYLSDLLCRGIKSIHRDQPELLLKSIMAASQR